MEFRQLVRDVVRTACRTALLDAGFTPDDYFYDALDASLAGTNTAFAAVKSSLSLSPLSASVTASIFHSRLITYLFYKSFQP